MNNKKIGKVRLFALAALLGGLLLPGMALTATARNTGGMPVDRITAADKNMRTLFGTVSPALSVTDPELAAIRDRLVYGEIGERGSLDDRQRQLITLVVLTAGQALDGLKAQVNAALKVGATPVEIKEALYQCAPYIGFPKTEAALRLVNEAFQEHDIPLPVAGQATVTEDSRFAEGLKVQTAIFGDAIAAMHRATPDNQQAVNVHYLSAFCFGDIYTRQGLDLKNRELLTFSIISALGGCESQVKSHVQANANVGNTKENLIDALAQSLPYMGFPRTLNALACVNAVLPEAGRTR